MVMTGSLCCKGHEYTTSQVSNQTSLFSLHPSHTVRPISGLWQTELHDFHLQQLMLNEKTAATTTLYQDLRPSVTALLVYAF